MLNLCCAIDKMDKTFSSTTRFEIKLPVPQGFVVARPRLLAKSERVKGSDCFWALFNSLPSHVKLCTWWRASKMSDLRLTFGGYKTQKVWRALTAMRGVDQIIINFPRAIIRFRADIRLRVSKGCNIKAVLGTKRLGQSLNEKPGPQLQGKPEWISEWAPMNAGPSPWTALGSCVGQHVFFLRIWNPAKRIWGVLTQAMFMRCFASNLTLGMPLARSWWPLCGLEPCRRQEPQRTHSYHFIGCIFKERFAHLNVQKAVTVSSWIPFIMFILVLEALKAPWQTVWVFADDIHQELTMNNF